MKKLYWAFAVLILSLVAASQGVAKDLEGKVGKGPMDHRVMAKMYDEEADTNKRKAERWEFAAEYHEKFPELFSDQKMSAAEHIDDLRSIAHQYRETERHDREMASRHRAMIRSGP